MIDYWNKCKKKIDVICNVAILCENEYVIKTCTCLIKSMNQRCLSSGLLINECKTYMSIIPLDSFICTS